MVSGILIGTLGQSCLALVYRSQVQLQIYIIAENEHRPLDVMCCTWNVGNAQPSMALDEWLSGVPEQEHDLVAIGEQRGLPGRESQLTGLHACCSDICWLPLTRPHSDNRRPGVRLQV